MENAPRVILIAGPNGAGKTTFAQEFLRRELGRPVFINADHIASNLRKPQGGVDILAGKLMLRELERHATSHTSFSFETTLSGRTYLQAIPRWQAMGYQVKLIFLQLDSVEEAIARVAYRVCQGGHGVPEHIIRRRFAAGYRNFKDFYVPLVDAWALYNNSGAYPVLQAWGEKL